MKQINVVGGIIIKNGQVLSVQRGPGRSLEYYWEFPGGKIETGENQHEALERELKEELDIEVDLSDDIYDEASYVYSFGQVNLTTIICHLKQGEPRLNEHVDKKWLNFSELESVEWAPADIPAVKKLISEYGEA